MRIERLSSKRRVAERGTDMVHAVLAEKPNANLLLPAGRSPVLFYEELVRRHRSREIDLARARFYQLDELVGVASGDRRSFNSFLREHLVEPAGLDRERVHLLDGCASDPSAEIERHSATLEAAGDADFALLGIGRNGHVAFNEPGSTPREGGRLVRLSNATLDGLRHIFAPDELPTEGITLGIRELYAAHRVALLATGSSKAEILATLAKREVTPALPASFFVNHAAFDVLADSDACGRV